MWIRSLIVMLSCSAAASIAAAQSSRSAELRRVDEPPQSVVFVPEESAALFVGVEEFDDRSIPSVPYAVDDAIDLAYTMAFERPTPLVAPNRIVLALAGKPQKSESQRHLQELRERGADDLKPPTHSKMLTLVEQQAAKVGPNGVLIIAIATHGSVGKRGQRYFLAQDSVVRFPATAVSAEELLQLAAVPTVPRSLILLDTCRTNLETDRGTVQDEVGSATPFLEGLAQVSGRVILNAAAEGRAAYDDPARQNGVFTAAVIDGLQCRAEPDARGLITVQSLASYVNTQVRSWVKIHKHKEIGQGIDIALGGGTETMPLAQCRAPQAAQASALPVILQQLDAVARNAAETAPANAQLAENTFSVYNVAHVRLWSREVKGRAVQTEIADLDGDGEREVIVGVAGRGEDAGKILVYDARGQLKWTASTTAPFNYDDARAGRLVVEKFATGDLFRRKTQQIVVLSNDSQGFYPSRLTIFDTDGSLLSSYWHPGRLHDVAIGAAGPHADVCIIASGTNYPLRKLFGPSPVGVVFALDPRAVAGEAPPYRGRSRHGTHLWYAIIRPVKEPMGDLEIGDFHHVGGNEILLRVSQFEVFYLTFAGELKEVQREGKDGPGPLFDRVQ